MVVSWLRYLQGISDFFGSCLGDPFLWYPTNPYAVRKDLGIDYRFWNEFHSNFYAATILASKKTKIIKMQYIDWDEMQEKEEPEFGKVIKICDRFQLSDIMDF